MCVVDEMLIFIFISSALVNFYEIVGNRGDLLSKQENDEFYDKLMKINDETSQVEGHSRWHSSTRNELEEFRKSCDSMKN